MKFLLLWVVLMPVISFLKFVAADLIDCLVVHKKVQTIQKVQKKSTAAYSKSHTYKKAQ